jgi:hypothetical protein
MDALVHQKGLAGAALTQAVSALMPGSSIEEVLDGVRNILNQRILRDLKRQDFTSGLHVVESLYKQRHDVVSIVDLLITDVNFPEILRKELRTIRDSGLMNSFCKFVHVENEPVPKGCFCFSTPRDRKA